MSSGSRLLLIGLRGSGKTSYLAALWHLIEAGELPTALLSSQLQPDRTYLNQIRESWLKFEEVGRTSLRGQEIASLLLRDARTGANIDVTVPDLSGEFFRLQWATRRATRQYAAFAAESSGMLLFIHPATIKTAPRIPLAAATLDLTGQLVHPSAISASATDVPITGPYSTEWSSNLSSTQVQLVELLQFVSHLRYETKSIRLAVIVSAWDLIRGPILPTSWLESHLPLLSQFLDANADTVPFRVFGISALGGDLQKDMQRLQDEAVPSRRIKVIDNKLESHGDLTAPIRFLLDLDGDRTKPVEQ